MIRRLLILTGGLTIILAGVCLLSHTWQFGYVGSSGSVGLREGKLWYIWRTNPISDGEGLYADDASAVNRAMYSISAGARWREEPIWSWLLVLLATVGYALILPPIRRLWKRPTPRWLIGTLTVTCVLLAALWTTSHLATVTYDGSHLHLCLEDGMASMFVDRQRITTGLPWGTGWTVHRSKFAFFVHSGGYFTWRAGEIMVNVPLGTLLVVLLVPTIVLARPDRRAMIGHCRKCAYDLTGNMSGVCPECGTEIPKVEANTVPDKTCSSVSRVNSNHL